MRRTGPFVRCVGSLCLAMFMLSANGAEQVAVDSSVNLSELKKAFLESVEIDTSGTADDEAESRKQKLQRARENTEKYKSDEAAAKVSEEAKEKELQRIEVAEKEQKAAEAAIKEQAVAERLKQEKAESERQLAREREKQKAFQAQEEANKSMENARQKEQRVATLEMQNRLAEENIKQLEAQLEALAAENEAAVLRKKQREEIVRNESGQDGQVPDPAQIKTQTASDGAVVTTSNRENAESEIDREPGKLEKVGNIGKGMVTKEAEKRAKKGASAVIKEAFDQVLPF